MIAEAIRVGILRDSPPPSEMGEARKLLQEVADWKPGSAVFAGSDELVRLQEEVSIIKETRAGLAEKIRTARAMSGEAQGFTTEARAQLERLESIGLFDDGAVDHDSCPVCANHLKTPIPGAQAIGSALAQLSQSLAATERERPQLGHYIERLNAELIRLSEQQSEKQNAIESLQNEGGICATDARFERAASESCWSRQPLFGKCSRAANRGPFCQSIGRRAKRG